MNTYNVTIPKSLSRMGDLVLVPRKEYESLLVLRKFKEYTPTALERKKLKRAELNFKKRFLVKIEILCSLSLNFYLLTHMLVIYKKLKEMKTLGVGVWGHIEFSLRLK